MRKIFLLIGMVLVVAACSKQVPTDVPTQEPLPTLEPLETLEPLPTLNPLPTYTAFPTLDPTLEVLPTDTPEPTATVVIIVPTPEPVFVKVLGTTNKYAVRQVCFNVNGLIYNDNGYPVISDCVYPLKGAVSDRIVFYAGNKIEVESCGDCVFLSAYGVETNFLKTQIKADGGNYFVLVQRGVNGELLFIQASLVKLITN